jgi:hypothetical protein
VECSGNMNHSETDRSELLIFHLASDYDLKLSSLQGLENGSWMGEPLGLVTSSHIPTGTSHRPPLHWFVSLIS